MLHTTIWDGKLVILTFTLPVTHNSPYYFSLTLNAGGDVDETVRDRYAANLQTHRGYTLRFNHETPESLQLTIQGSAKNEWLVVALPYPSATTFTITTSYENAPVTSVGSRDLVDKYHYHFDGSHLYVMIRNSIDSVSEFEGFSNHDGYGSYTKIKASCPGGNCGNGAWGDSPQPAIPAALNDPTSKFKVCEIRKIPRKF